MSEDKLEALIRAPYMPRIKRLYLMAFAPPLWRVLARVPWGALEQICVVRFSPGSADDTQGLEALSPP